MCVPVVYVGVLCVYDSGSRGPTCHPVRGPLYIFFSLRIVLLFVEVVGFSPKYCNLGFHAMFGALY